MAQRQIKIPVIPEANLTQPVNDLLALVEQLMVENNRLKEVVQQLRDEIAVLKKEKSKPKIKPSNLDRDAGKNDDKSDDGKNTTGGDGKRPGSTKRSKTDQLVIHVEEKIAPSEPIPPGSRFKGFRDYVVQDIQISTHNVLYRMECWLTPDGRWLTGQLPVCVQGNHFGPTLRGFILYQYHHCHVTQPLLLEQLSEWGVDISVGQINAILATGNESFINEKKDLLVTGLEVCPSVTVDDTGARHKGKNGYATHIGNDFFAWFQSTNSKSRINFLEILHAGTAIYHINDDAISYMQKYGLAKSVIDVLESYNVGAISGLPQWNRFLDLLSVTSDRHRKIATEGALIGGLFEKGLNPILAIISDGAGQFAVLLHGMCWVHAERLVHTLIPFSDLHRQAIDNVRSAIWELYADLNVYRKNPDPSQIVLLEQRFDAIFTQNTGYETLNQTLKRLHDHKKELLLVLQRPDVPLHTNGSESDIREYAKRRKVSGGTRSDSGRVCRDTFISLKKTCRKLGISFWEYLMDRLSHAKEILPLADIVRQRAALVHSGVP